MVSVGWPLLKLEAISDLSCWLIGTVEHWEKNDDELMFFPVQTDVSTLWAIASTTLTGFSLLQDLPIHLGWSPTRSAMIKSDMSFSVSMKFLLIQKLKLSGTPVTCSYGRSKGAASSKLDILAKSWQLTACNPRVGLNNHFCSVQTDRYNCNAAPLKTCQCNSI